ncbi:hydrogenase large subunit [Methylosinus trichosporium]|uniref:Hydrogenase expression protein HypE n=2 Tax=Methylosinus TaxID=425 RepID=A0A2D2D451_METT3|nr:hydrogenase expression protein HypE [Methylosinus trichosporium OB3b]
MALETTELKESMFRGDPVAHARGWPRHVVDRATWLEIVVGLAEGQGDLLGLWSDGEAVHMAVMERAARGFAIVTLECPDKSYPSVGRLHPPALRLERAIRDIYGVEAEESPDARRWLDHGRWGVRRPGAAAPSTDAPNMADSYEFLPVEGAGLHQIPVGPVHAGIIEPGHFRFTANGELVVRLEERLGYTHKGVETLMAGATLARGARLAGRVSGDSTVAYAIAFAGAVESALEMKVPRRAVYLRALMAELERLANHFGDIGAICNDAAFALMNAHCGVVRERFLRANRQCFGHRLLMDRVTIGGVTADVTPGAQNQLRKLVEETKALVPRLIELFGDTTSLQDRTVGTGHASSELVSKFGCGGVVGRASGRAFDARRTPGYAPYEELSFTLGASTEGDVDARVWVRFDEVRSSLSLVEQILDILPGGEWKNEAVPAPGAMREGVALVEGFRGDILAWVRIGADGMLERCQLRDPSWFQWPLLEAAIERNIVADFPLLNKSFNCSYSGTDL